jgi:hypothetical protein
MVNGVALARPAPETWSAPGLSLGAVCFLGAHLGWVIRTEIPIRDIGSQKGNVVVGKGWTLIKLTAASHHG